MNSVVVSGTYKAVVPMETMEIYETMKIYEKQSMDANSNWWFFYYDTNRSGWEFHYGVDRVIPGLTLMGTTVSSSNKPGEL